MTYGHLLFSLLTTGYIIIGATLEERDHEALMGSDYVEYKKNVPMFIPIPGKKFKSADAKPEAETN
ncbi:isoprenylcysteine carboxylmethyltransferase family protein, partial [candidate division KSB1 bacterium]|nr:isoprenylcysteine carboxylmethyltransferase family protein [candidate division KSB1 bacterium]